MTLEQHAAAISAAIRAAHDDGFELDDGYSNAARLDLNKIVDGDFTGVYVEIDLPSPTYL